MGLGDTECAGEVDEVLEGRGEAGFAGIQQFVGFLRACSVFHPVLGGFAVDVMVARAEDAMRGAESGAGEELGFEPSSQLVVALLLALPGEVAGDEQGVIRLLGESVDQQVEGLLALTVGEAGTVAAEVEVREVEEVQH